MSFGLYPRSFPTEMLFLDVVVCYYCWYFLMICFTPLFFSILFYCSFLLFHGRDDTVVLVVMVNLLMVIFLIICWGQMGWKHLILTELVCIRSFFTPMRPRINGLLEVGAVSLLEWSFG